MGSSQPSRFDRWVGQVPRGDDERGAGQVGGPRLACERQDIGAVLSSADVSVSSIVVSAGIAGPVQE